MTSRAGCEASSIRRLLYVFLFFTSGVTSVLHAQRIEDARVAPGTPLQVSTATGSYRSVAFLSQSGGELTVQEECGSGCSRAVSIPWSEVTRVDANIQVHSVTRALLDGAIGAASTSLAILGAALLASSCKESDAGSCESFALAKAAPIVVTLGGAIGLAYGWGHTHGEWRPVWPRGLRR